MADVVGQLEIKLGFDTKSMDQGMQETESKVSKLGGAMQVAFGQLAADAIKRVGSAVLNLGKSAVSAYADYEQLVGGVETLFGTGGLMVEEYAAKVGKSVDEVSGEYDRLVDAEYYALENADNAYKTAGLSANQYMETATSFAASLIQGLGGDTLAAVDMADKAIVDMSDNANKMGTDISRIQDAYQGFAKQNYTMLDNLKLGYGGTATEMARLINDSGVLGDTMTVTSKNINEVSFDKIVEAIHVVQDNMGITGTTSKEAADTISGSINTMKAAWENMLVSLAGGGQDFQTSIDALVESVGNVTKNLIPVIGQSLNGVADLIAGLAPIISAELPGLVSQLLPALVSAATSIVVELAKALPGILSSLVDSIIAVLPSALEAITSAIPEIVQSIVDAIMQIATLLTQPNNLQMMIKAFLDLVLAITKAVPQIVKAIVAALPPIIKGIVEFLTDPSNIAMILSAAVELFMAIVSAPLDIIGSLLGSLGELLAPIGAALGEFFVGVGEQIGQFFSSLGQWFAELPGNIATWLGQVVSNVGTWVSNMVGKAIELGGQFLGAIGQFFSQLPYNIGKFLAIAILTTGQFVGDMVSKAIELGAQFLANIVNFFAQLPGNIANFLTQAATNVAGWVVEMAGKAAEAGTQFLQNIVNFFTQLPGKIWEFLTSTISKAATFVGDMAAKALEAGKMFFDNLVNKVMEIPGKMLEIGKNIVEGIWNGISGAAGWLWDQITGFCSGIVDGIKEFFGIESPSKLFRDEVGVYMAQGIGVGFTEEMGAVNSEMQDALASNMPSMTTDASVSVTADTQIGSQLFTTEEQRVAYVEAMTAFYQQLTDQNNQHLSNYTAKLNEWVTQTQNKVQEFTKNIISKITQFGQQMATKATEIGKNFYTKILEQPNKLPDKFKEIGTNIIKGLEAGMRAQEPALMAYVDSLCAKIVAKMQAAMKIHSPSQVMADEVGAYMAQGVGLGFDEEMKSVSKEMAGAMPSTAIDGLSGWSSAVNNIFVDDDDDNTETREPAVISQTNNIYSAFDFEQVNEELLQEIRRVA